MSKKNVFVIGLDDFNLAKLKRLPSAKNCEFYPALSISDIRGVAEFDMEALIKRAIERIESFSGSVDAVVSYYDFPGTTLAPILCQRYGLRSPTLRSIMKCENKYWSRLEQRKVIIDNIPQFQAFDPFDPDAYQNISLYPPYWIKPIKSFRSFLAYRIHDERVFSEAMKTVQANIDYINKPFHFLMQKYRMPDFFTYMKESCIAESILSGSQCTLEGYVFEGEVVGYGVVDSVREVDSSSFSRYEYPSSLPLDVQYRMIEIARRALNQIGIDDAPFNIEFFYNQTEDRIYLLEINPRVSQAHTDIFEKVHGFSHLQIMLDVALGKRPQPMEKKGEYQLAANFMLRVFENGTLTKVPTPEEIEAASHKVPGASMSLRVKQGQKLSDLKGQDSYSYELANIFLGANSQKELLDKYYRFIEAISFEIKTEQGYTITHLSRTHQH